jgi:DNA-binding PadR family transcriptional regulator
MGDLLVLRCLQHEPLNGSEIVRALGLEQHRWPSVRLRIGRLQKQGLIVKVEHGESMPGAGRWRWSPTDRGLVRLQESEKAKPGP